MVAVQGPVLWPTLAYLSIYLREYNAKHPAGKSSVDEISKNKTRNKAAVREVKSVSKYECM
jgi:hypothetical protein